MKKTYVARYQEVLAGTKGGATKAAAKKKTSKPAKKVAKKK
jgi:hypothetical protein